jgi:hypothetical protein
MALFGSESKEEKQMRKANELLAKYGLEELSDPRDVKALREISLALMGNKLIELGTAMQGNGADSAMMSYQRAIMEQNFIIIRLLDKIANK